MAAAYAGTSPSLSSAQVIVLSASYSPTLADMDLEDTIKAWPHLEIFHLFQDGEVHFPDYEGLLPFSIVAPDLGTLYLGVRCDPCS